MNKHVLALFLALCIGAAPAHAQVRSSENYSITVDQINSGGGAASSANYLLRGSIGQPVDTQPMSSENYTNRPGFQAASPSPFLTVSPTSLPFGSQNVGTSSAGQGVTLTNSGNVAINLSSIAITGANAADFGQGGCGSGIPVAGNCVTTVVFTPQAVGPRSGALDISANAPSNATSVALTGTGVGVPEISVSPLSLPFGPRPVGIASAALTVTVENLGSALLNYSASVTGTAGEFVVQASGCNAVGSLGTPGDCQMAVVFTPQALGARSATLVIASNDADENPVNVELTGTGISRVRRDFNGDGKSDILWRNVATGENYLYPMNGTTILGTEGYLRTVADLNWKVAGIGDFDGDGKFDVLWRNTGTGENYVYFMDGTTIKPTEGYIRTVADQNWQVAGVGDFNGDGKDDILWRHLVTGQNYLYPMNGLAILGTEGYLRTVADLNWTVAGIGDLDGDGKADVLWRNSSSGQNYAYFMDGTTIKPTEGYVRTVASQSWQVAGMGDYNGDGKSDVLWRNNTTGENYLYPMNGLTILGTEGYLRTVADLGWQVKGTGDYDGDGKADVLWRHATSGENYVYPMDGTTIKPTEGYVRTVPQPSWQVQNPK